MSDINKEGPRYKMLKITVQKLWLLQIKLKNCRLKELTVPMGIKKKIKVMEEGWADNLEID